MFALLFKLQHVLNLTRKLDFLAPLALRLYLFSVFWVTGNNKIHSFNQVVTWFSDGEWGLGLPAPLFMAILITATELMGAVSLLLGLGVRWMSIPLMIAMAVAAVKVHWENGWQTIADQSMCLFNCDSLLESMARMERAHQILKEYSNYEWLTQTGNIVIHNNGMEMVAVYFMMLLTLFFIGGGRYVSLDYWFNRKILNHPAP